MTRTRIFLRVLMVVVGVALLLLPGVLMAIAWRSSLNVEVAALAILAAISAAVWAPKIKWIVAIVSSLLISVPPVPYWISLAGGVRHLHFFHGFSFDVSLLVRLLVVLIFALLLFKAIFDSINGQTSEGMVEK